MSWGIGSIGARSIESLIAEYSNDLLSVNEHQQYHAKDLADGLFSFVWEQYQATFSESTVQSGDRPPLGLFIGGFSAGEFFPETYVGLLPMEMALKEARPNT